MSEEPQIKTLAEVERAHILEVVGKFNGNMLAAARALGIGKTTLYRKMSDYCEKKRAELAAECQLPNANG